MVVLSVGIGIMYIIYIITKLSKWKTFMKIVKYHCEILCFVFVCYSSILLLKKSDTNVAVMWKWDKLFIENVILKME